MQSYSRELPRGVWEQSPQPMKGFCGGEVPQLGNSQFGLFWVIFSDVIMSYVSVMPIWSRLFWVIFSDIIMSL